jgi:DNA-binding transcriptional MerR regulator
MQKRYFSRANVAQMNYFTIKDIENLTGIKAHTWRIWEQRYNLCIPQRKESNHRFYDSDNLKQILRISYLYHSGIKISKIAKLAPNEMIAASLKKDDAIGDHFYINQLLEASIDLDEIRFSKICDDVIAQFGVEHSFINIIYAFLERIGLLWLTDHIIPAQEHFTSNLLRQKLVVAIDRLPVVGSNDSPVTVLFTPEKEHHELPLLFIHYLLKKNGKQVRYFGCNIKLDDIKKYAGDFAFSNVHFHLITNLTNKYTQQYVNNAASIFADKTVYISGTQVSNIIRQPSNVRLLRSMNEIVAYANKH